MAAGEGLQRRFERLDGQMTRLAQDYGTLAARLCGRWRWSDRMTRTVERKRTPGRAAEVGSRHEYR